MARAIWKGPFVEESLIKKVEKLKEETNKKKNSGVSIFKSLR